MVAGEYHVTILLIIMLDASLEFVSATRSVSNIWQGPGHKAFFFREDKTEIAARRSFSAMSAATFGIVTAAICIWRCYLRGD